MDLNGMPLIPVMGGISIVAGLISLYDAFVGFGEKMKIEDTPTSKVRSIAAGLVELKGRVAPREALIAPFSKRRCVIYNYIAEELRVRREYDPFMKRMVVIREWVQVRSEGKSVRFFLEDETGRVLVDPTGADIQDRRVFYELSWPRRRHTERAILCNSIVYVMGTAAENPEKPVSAVASEAIMIRKGGSGKGLMITSKTEGQVIWGYRLRFLLSLVIGLILLALGAWMILFFNP